MRLIRQRRMNDCGVAAVAMVCSVSYERALNAFTPKIQHRMRVLRAGTTTGDVTEAIRALGWECDSRLRPLRKRELKHLTGRAVLCVRAPSKVRGGHWHWMVFEDSATDWKVLDPATELQPYVVTSYIRVWKPE